MTPGLRAAPVRADIVLQEKSGGPTGEQDSAGQVGVDLIYLGSNGLVKSSYAPLKFKRPIKHETL